MKEADIDKRFRKWLLDHSVASYKMSVGYGGQGEAGWPDRLVIVPGEVSASIYFVELKTETGKLTKRQQFVHDRLHYCRANVCTLYGWGEVASWCQLLKAKHALVR